MALSARAGGIIAHAHGPPAGLAGPRVAVMTQCRVKSAFRFRTRQDVDALDFSQSDVQRDVKLVLESEPSEDGAHLMHTRGLCKFGRPELLCFVQPDDGALMGRVLNQLARTLMEGVQASQIRLRIADGVELVTKAATDAALVDSLGVEAAVLLGRADGAPLVGLTRLAPDR